MSFWKANFAAWYGLDSAPGRRHDNCMQLSHVLNSYKLRRSRPAASLQELIEVTI